MKLYNIYTDASVGHKNLEQYSICGVIVVDSHILDIYYKHRFKLPKSVSAERTAIRESVQYVISKYGAKKIIVHSDCKRAMYVPFKNVIFKFVKGHNKEISFKYKYNRLADWICKNGVENWKDYWYSKL